SGRRPSGCRATCAATAASRPDSSTGTARAATSGTPMRPDAARSSNVADGATSATGASGASGASGATVLAGRERIGPIDFSGARVLVVGDLMLDRYWCGDVDRISPEAPVPVVRVRRSEERLGGAANVALNAVVLGAPATLLGVVGDDEAGRRVAELARARGIDARLAVDPDLPTTIKLRVIGRQQQ